MKKNTPIDPFEDALKDLRVSGNVLFHRTYSAPWAIKIPDENSLRPILGVTEKTRIMPFHFVRKGSFKIAQGEDTPKLIGTRELAICPGGKVHFMSSDPKCQPTDFTDILAGKATPELDNLRTGEQTTLLCGVFLIEKSPLNPLLAALPPVLKINASPDNDITMLDRAAEMLEQEVTRGRPDSFTAKRLVEVFCAEAISSYMHQEGIKSAGWFKGLSDEKIATALAHLHGDPGRHWTIDMLADIAALSPSRFASRFRDITGQSVMSYVASWRMNIACRLLSETDKSLAEIASEIGYKDVTSFSRAFKAMLEKSPSQWRGEG